MTPFARKRLNTSLCYLGLVLWLLVCIMPALMLFGAALQPTALFRSPAEILSLNNITLQNFYTAFRQGDFVFFLRNSLIISSAAVVLSLLVCTPLSYGLTKIGKRSRSIISYTLLSFRFLPYVVLALPLYLFFLSLGLTGTRSGLLLAHLTMHLPFATWLLVGFFDTVPSEVEEAAIIDGCNPWGLFWSVALPIATPGIIACAILLFIISWNEFLFALFLGGRNAQPLTVGISRFVGGVDVGAQYGVIAAYASLVVLPVIVFALLANRWIVQGMTAGAVKG